MEFDLDAYFSRIGYNGPRTPNVETLIGVHRAHLLAIPYENLDIQSDVPVSMEIGAIFEKIVRSGRGGWCYEMNGLLGAALETLGFQVTRLAGGVHRAKVGDAAFGNHLVLKVNLDEPWLCDAGFGDGLREPIPLAEGVYTQGPFQFRLERLPDGIWRFHNHDRGSAPSFDVVDAPADEELLSSTCHRLQTAADSNFVLNAVAQRHVADGLAVLRGRVFRELSAAGTIGRVIQSEDEFARILEDVFDLRLANTAALWPKIVARHEQVFAPRP